LSSNSWMQTPQGHEVIDGIVVPVDWFAIVFNPSFPYRLAHMALASFLSTSLFVAASAAWLLLKKRDTPEVRKMLVMAVLMLMVTAPLQAFVGDMHGLNTLKHQPAKIAAIEGHWDNSHGEPTPLILFGVPDMQREETRFALEIPALGSLLLMHDIDKQVPALKDFPAADRPNSTVVFWSFRLMVGLGLAMILLGLSGVYLARKGRLFTSRRWLRLAVAMGPAGLIAILAGWFTTEVGRQPWVIYGLMRTEDAVSAHSAVHLSISLTAFVTVYFIVFGTGINYIFKLIKKGPEGDDSHAPSGGPGKPRTPSRPLSAIEESLDGTTH
ncbi:cytochrome ubiquinol oxidase subunit I, partial [uncultured Cobetia sp.]|uniref:cytochrome ubiquinol oxidase subunit I n=1 Tax=uncultured Cobetia sp. TaxID=410706 RepID=UPI00259891B7